MLSATSPLALLVLALSLSADAFAASLGRGACARPDAPAVLWSGLVFGAVAAAITVTGWAIADLIGSAVAAWDHWVAFALLGAVGGRMLFGAAQGTMVLGGAALLATAIGTSIDAAAVGGAMALAGAGIWSLAAATGVATAAAAALGLVLGRWAGLRWGTAAEAAGGGALMLLGTVILCEHMGWLP